MKRVYKTANGKMINMDALIAQNEKSIAVGNMKVNARGDELGPGGKIDKSREKLMSEYYKLNTPVVTDNVPVSHKVVPKKDLVDDWIEPMTTQENNENTPQQETDKVDPAAGSTRPLRGSLAGAVAKNQPAKPEAPKKSGPSRI